MDGKQLFYYIPYDNDEQLDFNWSLLKWGGIMKLEGEVHILQMNIENILPYVKSISVGCRLFLFFGVEIIDNSPYSLKAVIWKRYQKLLFIVNETIGVVKNISFSGQDTHKEDNLFMFYVYYMCTIYIGLIRQSSLWQSMLSYSYVLRPLRWPKPGSGSLDVRPIHFWFFLQLTLECCVQTVIHTRVSRLFPNMVCLCKVMYFHYGLLADLQQWRND